MFPDQGTDDAHDLPPGLEQTIRAIISTSNSAEDLAGRVQRALSEHSAPTDEVHVSHALASHAESGVLLYSALIILRPRSWQETPGA